MRTLLVFGAGLVTASSMLLWFAHHNCGKS